MSERSASAGEIDVSNSVVAMACDHAGVELKEILKAELEKSGHSIIDLGTTGPDPVDYPDFGRAMADALREGRAARGIVICGSGIGISIAANRHAHVRAALCVDGTMARLARLHNDANVLALGSRVTGVEAAKDCVKQFLATPFEGGRHAGRVAKLSTM
ncbi:MAG TPA: ribose 5-phosphate isomerase B [Sneathiellales bacterium]|nr:ribose 5-phosphate isomerase B [Sneathiellales bacterium]